MIFNKLTDKDKDLIEFWLSAYGGADSECSKRYYNKDKVAPLNYLLRVWEDNKEEYLSLITTKGTGKRVRLQEFECSSRTRRGIQVIREVKSNPYQVLKTFIEDTRSSIGLKGADISIIKMTELPILDRYSTGSQISKQELIDAFVIQNLVKITQEQESLVEVEDIEIRKEEMVPKKEKISLQEIDDRLMTIDDFLK